MKFKKGDKCLCYGFLCTIVDIDDNIAVLKSKAFDDGNGHDEVTFALNELKRVSEFNKILKLALRKPKKEQWINW